MKNAMLLAFIVILAASVQADLLVTSEPVKVLGQKAIVKLDIAMNPINPGDPVPYMNPWNYLAGFYGGSSDATTVMPENNNSGMGIGFQYHNFVKYYSGAIRPQY